MKDKDKDGRSSEPVQPSEKELNRLATLAAAEPGLMQYPHTAGGAPVVPTEEGLQKAHSLDAMQQQTGLQMDILSDFVKLAMSHAQKINARRIISRDIYDAKIRFTARIGHTYFLYVKADTARTDTARTDTARTDTARTDTARTDTARTDTARTDTARTDTARTDTARTDTARTDTARTDTARTDTARTDTAKTDTAKTDTAKTDTAKTDTAKTDTAKLRVPITENNVSFR